jgi:hypothetical protein
LKERSLILTLPQEREGRDLNLLSCYGSNAENGGIISPLIKEKRLLTNARRA